MFTHGSTLKSIKQTNVMLFLVLLCDDDTMLPLLWIKCLNRINKHTKPKKKIEIHLGFGLMFLPHSFKNMRFKSFSTFDANVLSKVGTLFALYFPFQSFSVFWHSTSFSFDCAPFRYLCFRYIYQLFPLCIKLIPRKFIEISLRWNTMICLFRLWEKSCQTNIVSM